MLSGAYNCLNPKQFRQAQMPESWQACATFLERRYPGEWGRYNRIDLNQTGETKHNVDVKIDAQPIADVVKDTVNTYADALRAALEDIVLQDAGLREYDPSEPVREGEADQ